MRTKKQLKMLFLVCLFIVPFMLLVFSTIAITNRGNKEYSSHDKNKKYGFPTRKQNFEVDSFTLYSKCYCQKEIVTVNKIKDIYSIKVSNIFNEEDKKRNLFYTYNVTREKFESLVTCDLYKVLRRGPNQNVVSYSIRDNEEIDVFKSLYLWNVQTGLENHYNGWNARVYYDYKQISQSDICVIECNNHRGTALRINNVDFCNVNALPYDANSTWDAGFMPEQTRRWLTFGDQFVNVFLSRDIDTCVFDREISAVNEWLKAGTLFHVMRDHPTHDALIVPGLWGHVTYANREISKNLFSLILKYAADKRLLDKWFWPIFSKNITIHDSFFCDKYGGEPFPNQRDLDNCFVGQFGCCGSVLNRKLPKHECPKQCRPISKVNDWSYC